MSFLALQLNKEKFEPHLLVIGNKIDASYVFDEQHTTFLNKKRVVQGLLPIINFLTSNKPDIAISAIAHLNTAMGIISFLFPAIKFIGRETSIASLINSSSKSTFSIWSVLSKLTPKRLTKIICQSNDMKNDLINNLGYPEEKMVIINNPINKKFKTKTFKTSPVKKLITVGRLVTVKGHNRIIEALAKIDTEFEYTIVGNGPLKDVIFEQIENLNLTSKVNHIPFSNEVEKLLHKNDAFLQGSFSEGFPNGLMESCAVGTPVLAFNAPGGTSEIIDEGVNGYMVETEEEFIKRLDEILTANWPPEQVSRSVHEKYNERKILNDYENLFLSTLQH